MAVADRRLIRLVCERCANRYAHVTDPACPVCDGLGTFAVDASRVTTDDTGWLAARAGAMVAAEIAYSSGPVPAKLLRGRAKKAGFLLDDDPEATGLSHGTGPVDYKVRAKIGREAGKLLRALHVLPTRPRKAPKRRTTAERAEEKAARKAISDALDRSLAEAATQRRRVRVQTLAEREALKSLATAHAEEFAEQVERELPIAALSEHMPWVPPPRIVGGHPPKV